MIRLGLSVGFMLGEVRLFFQPNQVVAWVLAAPTLGFLALGFVLTRGNGPQ